LKTISHKIWPNSKHFKNTLVSYRKNSTLLQKQRKPIKTTRTNKSKFHHLDENWRTNESNQRSAKSWDRIPKSQYRTLIAVKKIRILREREHKITSQFTKLTDTVRSPIRKTKTALWNPKKDRERERERESRGKLKKRGFELYFYFLFLFYLRF
jgi:hypothetical protein